MPPIRITDARPLLLHQKETNHFMIYQLPKITAVPITPFMKPQQWLSLSQLAPTQERKASYKNVLIFFSCLKLDFLSVFYYFFWHVLRSSLKQLSTRGGKKKTPQNNSPCFLLVPQKVFSCQRKNIGKSRLFLPAAYGPWHSRAEQCLDSLLCSLTIDDTTRIDDGKQGSTK